VELGHFELGGAAGALPVEAGATYEATLRMPGGRRVELEVTFRGTRYGPYVLVPAGPDPEAMLQGEEPPQQKGEG
jgi:hypothetical protein